MVEKTDPRESILTAAAKRILHYGYAKTTMTEIAADCGMSAGNIYRFFPSKIDIAEAMARRLDADLHVAYESILIDTARSASKKLSDFFQLRLERTFRVAEEHPKLRELSDIIQLERPKYFVEEQAQERLYIARILMEGVAAGEFALQFDLPVASDLVQVATLKFLYPNFWTSENLDFLKLELERLLIMLTTGLAARR